MIKRTFLQISRAFESEIMTSSSKRIDFNSDIKVEEEYKIFMFLNAEEQTKNRS